MVIVNFGLPGERCQLQEIGRIAALRLWNKFIDKRFISVCIVGKQEVNLFLDLKVNTIRIRLGHESLDVTLAYLKGKDAESEEAQEHANSSSLALYA